MGMGFAPTWLRQVSPPASQNHFNHWGKVPQIRPTDFSPLLHFKKTLNFVYLS